MKARGGRNKNTVIFNSAGVNATQILLRITNYSLKFPNSKLLQNSIEHYSFNTDSWNYSGELKKQLQLQVFLVYNFKQSV